MKQLIAKEPVVIAAVANIVVGIAAKYGLQLDPADVLTVVGVFATAIAFLVRHHVSPTASKDS